MSSIILLLIALLPVYLLRLEIFGIPTTVLELLFLSIAVVWLVQNRKRLKEIFRLERRWAVAIALLVLSATISALVAPALLSAAGMWKAYFMEPVLFFYILRDELTRQKLTTNHILFALTLGGLVPALTGIAQWIFDAGIPAPWDIERRVTGVFDYPNALGLYLGPLLVVSIGKLICHGERAKQSLFIPQWYWTLTAILFSTAIILAQSEAAIAATIITVTIMALTQPTWRKKTIFVSLVTLLLLFIIPSSRAYLTTKFTLQDTSGQVRIGQWTETLAFLRDHPILGAGLSGYPTAIKPYHTRTHIEIFQYPHNIFLNIWVELGLLGLISFFLLARLILFLPLSAIRYPLSALLTMFLHGFVDVPYFKNDLAFMTWALLALISYAASASHKNT